jgi:AcrR family transcriptional regulator
MYQYFPHKQALLYAVLRRHLDKVAEAVEAACMRHRGQSIAIIAEGLVTAYIDAKMVHAEAARALYLVAAELDTAELLGGVPKRIGNAATTLLASAADAAFEDLPAVAFALLAVMTGVVRVVFERGANPVMVLALRTQLVTMCRAYLRDVAMEIAAAPARHGRGAMPAN